MVGGALQLKNIDSRHYGHHVAPVVTERRPWPHEKQGCVKVGSNGDQAANSRKHVEKMFDVKVEEGEHAGEQGQTKVSAALGSQSDVKRAIGTSKQGHSSSHTGL